MIQAQGLHSLGPLAQGVQSLGFSLRYVSPYWAQMLRFGNISTTDSPILPLSPLHQNCRNLNLLIRVKHLVDVLSFLFTGGRKSCCEVPFWQLC